MTNTSETRPAAAPSEASTGRSTEAGRPSSDEVSRRTMLRGAAVGGLALPLLAACGGEDTSGGSDSSAGSAEPSAAESSAGDAAGGDPSGSAAAGAGVTVAAADVPVGGGTILKADKVVVTQPTKGDFKAFSAVCTHQGCTVGSVTDGQIVCPCHQSHFSIEDGSPVSGPASSPLAAKKATATGDEVSVT